MPISHFRYHIKKFLPFCQTTNQFSNILNFLK